MPSCRKATTKIWGCSISVAVVAAVAAAQNAAPQADAVADFMRAKLGHSQHVLEGLALEDYDLIARGAQELALASQASSWQVLQTEEYARQSAEFRRSCDALRSAAKQKNLDGSALAWMEVTMKCVQCHKYVRDQK
jgi:cell division septum initiation protein DivIVA